MNDITFNRYDGSTAKTIREVVEQIYVASREISADDPFRAPAAFMDRFDHYRKRPGFDMIVASQAGQPVGQTWGWPLAADTGWWNGMVTPLPLDATWEDGRRTFALSELMVVQDVAGTGVAHALVDRLLSGRLEQRATLLVAPDNDHAQTIYEHWGWHTVGQQRTSWEGSPLWNVLLLPLTAAAETTQTERVPHPTSARR